MINHKTGDIFLTKNNEIFLLVISTGNKRNFPFIYEISYHNNEINIFRGSIFNSDHQINE